MKKVVTRRFRTLPRKHAIFTEAYAEVISQRFSFEGKEEVELGNWQIRICEIDFVSTRGIDTRIRVYFPLTSKKRIVVSLSKSAKKEDIWGFVSSILHHAIHNEVELFKEDLHELIDYCMAHRPKLYIEYSTKRNYVLQEVKSLRILPRGERDG